MRESERERVSFRKRKKGLGFVSAQQYQQQQSRERENRAEQSTVFTGWLRPLLFFLSLSLYSFKRSFSLPLKHATPYFLTFLPFLFLSIFMSTTSSFTSTMVSIVVVCFVPLLCFIIIVSIQVSLVSFVNLFGSKKNNN